MIFLRTVCVLLSLVVTILPTEASKTHRSGQKRVICYFTNWSWYRQGDGKQMPEDIDPTLCTNVIYSFSTLNPNTLLMQTSDSWADLDNHFYKKVTNLKNKGVKVSLALGGWNDSQGSKYSSLLNSPSKRHEFVKETMKFLEKNGFEGLDLDIEYPSCPQGSCGSGNPQDKQGFSELIKELSAQFQKKGWVLSAAISASKKVIKSAYNVKDLSKYLDWIGVMTYDYHGSYDGKTGPNSPLHSSQGEPSIENTMKFLMDEGASSGKLILGIPVYGRSFRLSDPSNNKIGAPTSGPGNPGSFTREAGMLAFYEICQNINNGWTQIEDKNNGAYAHKNDQWTSYVSMHDVKHRVHYMDAHNLGGVMIWDLSLDDFKGAFCRKGKYPFLTEINKQMKRK